MITLFLLYISSVPKILWGFIYSISFIFNFLMKLLTQKQRRYGYNQIKQKKFFLLMLNKVTLQMKIFILTSYIY